MTKPEPAWMDDFVGDFSDWDHDHFLAVLALVQGKPTTPDAEGWMPYLMWYRSAPCPRDGCDYMAIEERRRRGGVITGICTKCGHTWRNEPGDDDE